MTALTAMIVVGFEPPPWRSSDGIVSSERQEYWIQKQPKGATSSSSFKSRFGTSSRVTAPTPSSGPVLKGASEEKQIVCYKCDEHGHNSEECELDVSCFVCEKKSHVTKRCMWPNQPKPIVLAVGLGHPDLGFFMAQKVKVSKGEEKPSTLGLIHVVSGSVILTHN